MLVMGGRVSGGIKTPTPTIANAGSHSYFHDYHADFRQVFREIVYAMGYDVNVVLPEVASSVSLGLF